MNRNYLAATSLSLLLAVMGTGCKPSSEASDSTISPKVDEVATVEESVIYDLYRKVDSLIQAGNTNDANVAFIDAVASEKFAPVRGEIFRTLIRYFLATDQIEQAKINFLAELRTAPDSAVPAKDYIYGYLLDSGDAEAALDWARTLTAQDLPAEIRIAATEWIIASALSAGDTASAVQNLTNTVQSLSADVAAPFAMRLARHALESAPRNILFAESVVSALSTDDFKNVEAFSKVIRNLTLRIFAAKGEFGKISSFLSASPGDMTDAEIAQILSFTFVVCREKRDFAALEAVSAAVIENCAKYPATDYRQTRSLCSRNWVSVLFQETPRPELFIERLDTLLKKGFAPDSVYTIFARHFYDVLTNKTVMTSLQQFATQIEPLLQDDGDRNQLRTYQMDLAFMLDDYDEALRLVEGGIAERDEAWHKMAATKLKAHIALRDKKYDEAANLFRAFTELLPDEDQSDPISGISYSKLTIAGNNEKRIGDFYTEAGEAQKAAEAYKNARDLLTKAIETNLDGKETAEMIKSILIQIPDTTENAEESNQSDDDHKVLD